MLALFVSLILFGICFCSFSLFHRFYMNKKGQLILSELDDFSGAFLYLWVFVGILACSFFIPGLVTFRALWSGLFLSVLVLYFSSKTLQNKVKFLCEFFLCLGGSFLLSPADFSSLPTALLFMILTTFFWMGAWRLFCYFDRFPFASFIMVCAWMIGILLAGQIVFHSPFMMTLTLLVGLVNLVCVKHRLKLGQMSLGKPLAYLMGYFWAGLWSFFLLRGAITSAFCAYSYYFYELILMLWAYWKKREICPMIGYAFKMPFGGKSLKIIFLHVFLAVAVTVMGINMQTTLLICIIALIFVHLHLSLTHLAHPTPTYRELFSDLKQGFRETYRQTKDAFHRKKLAKEKGTPHVSPKKKAVQKKPVKSKGKKKK